MPIPAPPPPAARFPIAKGPFKPPARPRRPRPGSESAPRPPDGQAAPHRRRVSCILRRTNLQDKNSSRSNTRHITQKLSQNPSPPVHNLCITCAQVTFPCAQLPFALCSMALKITFNVSPRLSLRQIPPVNIRIRGPPTLRIVLSTPTLCILLGTKSNANHYVSRKKDNHLMIDPATQTADTSTRLSRLKSIQAITDRGVRYERRWTDCGSKRCKRCTRLAGEKRVPSHGPYWYMITLDLVTHRRRTIYLGDKLDTTLYRNPQGGFDHDAHANRKPKDGPNQTTDQRTELLDHGGLRPGQEAPPSSTSEST